VNSDEEILMMSARLFAARSTDISFPNLDESCVDRVSCELEIKRLQPALFTSPSFPVSGKSFGEMRHLFFPTVVSKKERSILYLSRTPLNRILFVQKRVDYTLSALRVDGEKPLGIEVVITGRVRLMWESLGRFQKGVDWLFFLPIPLG
jgi:hypothetical protein